MLSRALGYLAASPFVSWPTLCLLLLRRALLAALLLLQLLLLQLLLLKPTRGVRRGTSRPGHSVESGDC